MRKLKNAWRVMLKKYLNILCQAGCQIHTPWEFISVKANEVSRIQINELQLLP